jgi:hypothetical protein
MDFDYKEYAAPAGKEIRSGIKRKVVYAYGGKSGIRW